MPRKTIVIAEVSEPREKQGSKGPYKIVDIKDAEKRRYSCLKPSLFEHLQVGATIDAEVKEEERDGNDGPYTSRTIMDIFVGGQSAAQKQGGQRSYGKSPEIVQYERASIEFNNAMSETGLCVREGKAPPDIEDAYWGHLRRLLRVGLPDASLEKPLLPHPMGQQGASAPKPIQSGIPQPRTALDDARDMDDAFEGTVARTFDSTLVFLKAAVNELGLTQTQILTALGIEKGADLYGHDLSVEWQKLVKWGEGNG